MLFDTDRDSLRRFYVDAWTKAQAGGPLNPMQAQVADVVAEHPEYQAVLQDPDRAVGHEYLPEQGETNPFLHMGLHLALREQVATDRPAGVAAVHRRLARRLGGAHQAEHAMMECLAEALWQAQRDARPPDEAAYLAALKRLAGAG
mgnify:CR=1 FL=1